MLIDRESGRWIHHGGVAPDGGPCRGDIFALVATLAGIDARRDFPRVIDLAAEIAGVSPSADPGELARRRAEYRARTEARERQAAEERAAAEERVPGLWAALARRHAVGERYLADRGLDPAELRERGDVVRYRADGAPCVLLHDFEGRPINIIARQIDRDPKVLSLSIEHTLGRRDVVGTHSTIGTLAGRVGDLDTTGGGPDVAVLVEGVADTIAAVLAFPGCVVLGANGAGRMVDVARGIAPRVASARGWLLVGVHGDEVGIAGATAALHAAVDAGLEIERSVDTIDIGEHKDLADAWRAGWRWQWPDRLGGVS